MLTLTPSRRGALGRGRTDSGWLLFSFGDEEATDGGLKLEFRTAVSGLNLLLHGSARGVDGRDSGGASAIIVSPSSSKVGSMIEKSGAARNSCSMIFNPRQTNAEMLRLGACNVKRVQTVLVLYSSY
jgi:hypothetical protein